MLDYIGGHVMGLTRNHSGHQVVLRINLPPWHQDDTPIERRFQVRGDCPGMLGDKLVVMTLDDEVLGWHNQRTGQQANLLAALPRARWRIRDWVIAAVLAWLGWVVSLALGGAGGLGWLFSAALWRIRAMRKVRGELQEALDLAAGVQSSCPPRDGPLP